MEKTFFVDVQQRVERYVQDRLLLFKLQSTEKIAEFSPKLVLGLLLVFTGFFVILFASLLLGYYLTLVTGSFFIGFGIILAIFLLSFFLIILLYKNRLKKYISDLVVKMIFSNSNQEVENAG